MGTFVQDPSQLLFLMPVGLPQQASPLPQSLLSLVRALLGNDNVCRRQGTARALRGWTPHVPLKAGTLQGQAAQGPPQLTWTGV